MKMNIKITYMIAKSKNIMLKIKILNVVVLLEVLKKLKNILCYVHFQNITHHVHPASPP